MVKARKTDGQVWVKLVMKMKRVLILLLPLEIEKLKKYSLFLCLKLSYLIHLKNARYYSS